MKLTLVSLMLVSGAAFAAAPINNISDNESGLAEQLNQLQRLIQARGAAQVNLQQQLSELQEELSELRGETETHAHKIDQIVDRQRELYIEIERRLENIQQPLAASPQPEQVADSQVDASYSASLNENDAYDQAVNLILKERRYDDAIPEFKRFISQFPNSVFIANAHYWLGQLLFNKSEYSEARGHFDKVINDFPESNKRSDALLKQGTVLQKLGNEAAAKKLFETVIADYPDTNSAKLASSRLSSLN
ncbi:MAG: tol-pal system protein YbgF [Gammaproteobacteria bacterium]|nr:tol-pal system protein YbgF [Gammaproteobacteria bacterium]